MRLVIIPVKPLAAAKERLASVLSAEERRALSLAMLGDVIGAASVLDEVWVLNSDPDASAVAADLALSKTDATPHAGLNRSLSIATGWAEEAGAVGVLVLSADLPTVTADDVLATVARPGVGLAPDRLGEGTNALWRSPPQAIEVAFGTGSRAVHESLAKAGGVPLSLVERPGLALDVDEPHDLRDAAERAGPHTREFLMKVGIAKRSLAWR